MKTVIVVGAGPAGMFCSYELARQGFSVILIDKGKRVLERESHGLDVMQGVGGAGLFSDGKLGLTPVLSLESLFEFLSKEDVHALIDYVNTVFTQMGVPEDYFPKDVKETERLQVLAKTEGMNLLVKRIRHVGSDNLPKVINTFSTFLTRKGVKLLTGRTVQQIIGKDEVKGVVLDTGERIECDFVVCCPGRGGSKWLYDEAQRLGIETVFQSIWVGVRVEIPYEIARPLTEVLYEPFLYVHTDTFDDWVRTFCTCPHGFVATEQYDDFVCVNGYSNKKLKSENTNFALLCKVTLTEPVEDTIKYGRSIARLSTTIGGGKPIIQRLGDLRKGRRSSWNRINKSYVTPTLTDVTPGDISMALPSRVVNNILEALIKMDKLMPGLNSNSTLLYAPEVKLSSVRVATNKDLMTSVKNFFVAGDGAGVSGNIVGAACTGVIAARGVAKACSNKSQ